MPFGENTSAEGSPRVQALDLLRLITVLAVALFHYGFGGPGGITDVAFPQFEAFAKYGYLGVKVFFVISGFVIAHSTEGRTPIEFAIARIVRIYPGFLFCMTLTFLVTWAFGEPYLRTTATQWAANIVIAAPALKQPYMDDAYWSIVMEVIFYGWVYLMMSAGLFRRRVDAIVFIWLSLSLLNELVLGSAFVRKTFLTDASGFFATGVLLYELHVGRRNAALQCLLAFAAAVAVFQAVSNLQWWRAHSLTGFDDWTVATISIAGIVAVMAATRIRRLPLPAGVVIAIGGLTYPFFLLHQYIGYITFKQIGPVAYPLALFATVVLTMTVASWAIWRYVERSGQRLLKRALNRLAARIASLSAPGIKSAATSSRIHQATAQT
jgi:peptidoglycan/LPS O-acetylase OafA/YrhL